MGALGDQLALELGKRSKDAESETAIGGRRVDLRAGTGQDLQPDPARPEILRRRHEVTQIATEPVELPDDKRVAWLERLQAGGEARSGIMPTRGHILIDAGRIDAGREQRVALRLQRLRAVRLGHSDIADEQCVPRQKRPPAWCKMALVFTTGFLVVFGPPGVTSPDREITARFPCSAGSFLIDGIRRR